MARHEDQLEANAGEETPEAARGEMRAPRRRRRVRAVLLGLAGVSLAGLGAVWFEREDIADNLVGSELAALGLPATYDIVRIGPGEQVFRNLVVGDAAHPDLTVREVRIATRLYLGWPGIGRITVVAPRLYGRVRQGKASFGYLDKVLFSGKAKPGEPVLPDLDVAIVDGRARIETDAGPVGLSLAGEGGLRGGFRGALGASARALSYGGCHSSGASLYGTVRITEAKPRLSGPLRLADLSCPQQKLHLAGAGAKLDLTLGAAFDRADASFGLRTRALGLADGGYARLGGTGRISVHDGIANAQYDLSLRDPYARAWRLSRLDASGSARVGKGLRTIEIENDLSGRDLVAGPEIARALQRGAAAAQGTFLAALADKLRVNLARQLHQGRFTAHLIARRNARGDSLVVPQARLSARDGRSLVEFSRVQALAPQGVQGPPQLSANFISAGPGLPSLSGRMETQGHGETALHVRMDDYASGKSHLAIPELVLRQDKAGNLALAGDVRMGGALPGGAVENLRLPVAGRWSANGALSLWPGCTTARFDRLEAANLSLERDRLTLCPPGGHPIFEARGGDVRFAASTASLDLAGKLGDTPVQLTSGPVSLAYPGSLSARAITVGLGPADARSRFVIGDLSAEIGAGDSAGGVHGTFAKADVALAAVPLDLFGGAGQWRFAEGALTLDKARFDLRDRVSPARFKPLVARDAQLRLADNTITATARLREPKSDREVVRADIVHHLGDASGHAALTVPGLVFDKKLQPDALSDTLMGLVSSLKGSVQGTGRIDWNAKGITSTGRFASDGLDFAAPFGPVQGLSGTVAFTDLLGLVTAPNQTIKVRSINPGIEVNDGVASFDLHPGYRLVVHGAQWPFMQGTLRLEPVTMTVGAAETRRYTLVVEGLNAQSLIQRMDMNNLSASGVFDGSLPLIFDASGGRIENGQLAARAGGGNVAYVGALTYKDLSAMGNFAFDSLKSVDYKTMDIKLDGSLSGEIITRIRFTGVSQGQGAKRNFLTRQVAKLPIRFVVNIKAPFFQLFGNMRSLYDSNYVADPRALGLVDKNGKPIRKEPVPTVSIQPPVSEDTP
ncbi:YdbH domain-containing protein [Novosphingobium sp. 1949]|uniref:YdbH domain-containing protein n=1 Tax=Novosphingobium organovorum TaxID=2930092 RepID=A0ABT0B8G5_9SPHN|nr:YdbH domain-containing protein [Novosphingobium organovorum]MCJ2181360.1 YdbH domain-containing protein [Novosphingobium organovorum]